MTYEQLAQQLAEIHQTMLRISEYRKITDTNRGESMLLSCLARHDEPPTPAELSLALDVSSARVAALLNRLERKQLVRREKHPDNHRNTVVYLLPAGRALHEAQRAEFDRTVAGFLETLGPEKAALFVSLQREMVDYMTKQKQGGDHNG